MTSKGDSDQEQRNAESKNSGNWIWYLVLAGIMVLSAGVFFVSSATPRVKYPHLTALLQATQYTQLGSTTLVAGKTGTITVPWKTNPVQMVELSKLNSVRVDKTFVVGKLTMRILDDKGAPVGEAKEVEFHANKNSNENDTELKDLLTASNVDWGFADDPGFMAEYGPTLLIFTIVLIVMMLLMRRISGIGSPMSFGRSRGRLYAQEDIGVTFEVIAGVDEAVEEVREIVDFLRYPDKYQRLGGRIPKGVLLVGPPGTGKTLLAKAIAGEAGVPFFSLSGSDFVEMFVGVGAARVRDMFQQAQAKAPCIIFIDELDALGKSRSGNMVGVHDEREQTLNALLVEMDGFDPNNGIIVIAATNRPETLDAALLRPGRFDRNVLVDRPDKSGREQILKVHVKNVKLAPEVNLKEIASITSGFCGADLANLVNEAALLAARKGKNLVGQAEFDEGVERVTAGLEKKRRIMDEDEKLRVAYHEAAHALVAYSLPNTDPVHKVSIIPRGFAALGYTMQRPEGDRYLLTQSELESRLQVLLAGTLAEEIVFKDISTGAQNDLERASAIARRMVMEYGMSRLGRVNFRESTRSPFLGAGGGESYIRDHSEQTAREIDEEVKRIIDEAAKRAQQILLERKQALEAVTNRLIEIECMDHDELSRIIEASLLGPRVVPGTDSVAPRSVTGTLSSLTAAGKPEEDRSASSASDAAG